MVDIAHPLDAVTAWIEQYRAVWQDSLDRLDVEIWWGSRRFTTVVDRMEVRHVGRKTGHRRGLTG